ncbi:methyltransferase domain-containing protein [Sphingomonas morindae]|uniref:Class I SAM-dependent methyltransferase n=1 Tax=Sphingomonas morindae TaxID=1541170 RepID=A0ABY4X5Q0_9SPHN|nr:methyltransferase domain-containing protein [Sphingomonas morindae]USI72204.1 class I SAM-dependent methyltransferase [Sphingomonas morindae]
MTDAAPEIFDRQRRRVRRDRAAARIATHGFLVDHIADELLGRLDGVDRRFTRALLIGASPRLADALAAQGITTLTVDAGYALARAAGGIQADEDRLPIADGSMDLVLSAGVLDSVNDLPGALLLIRRLLRPDGLFLAGFAGAGSLPRLRAAMLAADLLGRGAAPRLHPQIDVRGAGDLLGRAGFTLQVADGEGLDVRYRDMDALLADLRFSGLGSVLAERGPALDRMQAAQAHAHFLAGADPDGRVTERFELVYCTAWSPDPSQPRPARRGSATASLAAALRPPA